MAESRPNYHIPLPDLSAPSEALKIVGNPILEEGADDQNLYAVMLRLNRKLTISEQDAVLGWNRPVETPAGHVSVCDDLESLAVLRTRLELVAQHQDALRQVVARIAAEGEEYRQQALAARNEAKEQAEAQRAERARREDLARQITFD